MLVFYEFKTSSEAVATFTFTSKSARALHREKQKFKHCSESFVMRLLCAIDDEVGHVFSNS
jgi:hypothetical protein